MFGFFARTGVAALAVFGACLAHGQSFNVDLEVGSSVPTTGAGVPSDSFGAAANQAGRWNRLIATSPAIHNLVDLAGNPTGVSVTGQTGGGGGFNNPNLTGDFALLMKDTRDTRCMWTINGLAPGQYRLFTYACAPNAQNITSAVVVSHSSTSNPQLAGGILNSNTFTLGITHTIHDIVMPSSNESLQITVDRLIGGLGPYVNGFQLVFVPEPMTLVGYLVGTILVFGRRRGVIRQTGPKE